VKADLQTQQMISTDTSTHGPPASSGRDNNQPGTWLAASLAAPKIPKHAHIGFLLFVGFAFLNPTHGKDAPIDKPPAGVTNPEPRDNGYQGASAAAPLVLLAVHGPNCSRFHSRTNDRRLSNTRNSKEQTYTIYRQRPARARREKTSTY